MPTWIAQCLQRMALSLLVLMMLASCSTYDQIKAERARKVNNADFIKIAVIWDKEVQDFQLVEGITLAVNKINEKGGIFGRKISLKVFYSKNEKDELGLARKVAGDTSFAAVIGHRSSAVAIPASVSYEYYGLLFLAPFASNINLTNHGFQYTFRTVASDSLVSKEIVRFMKSQGQKQIAIVDDRSTYGDGIADGLLESLADYGLISVVRRQYSPEKTDFKPLCADLLKYKFDALFVAGMLPQAGAFIREARQMGIRQRVYGGSSLDSRALERIAGNASNGTVVPTPFHLDLEHPLTLEFVKTFKKRYDKPPDTMAALGYDSMNILAEAMKRSKSADPSVVASNLRFIKNWPGVTGSFTYNLRGDLVGKISYFKFLNQTRFIYFDIPQKAEEAKKDKE